MLPGAGYSSKEPLLYYSIRILLHQRFKVLALNKIYADDPKWTALTSEAEARRMVEDDAVEVFREISKEFPGGLHTLLGRSLGTYAIACLLERDLIHPHQIVWQTPALGSKWAIMRDTKIRSLGIIGTSDHYYSVALPHFPMERVVIEGANHGMEIADDPIRSIDILRRVTEATAKWLQGGKS